MSTPTPSALASFSAQIHAAIAHVGDGPTARFGDRKVFLSAVRAVYVRQGGTLDLAAWRALLIDANRAGLVRLCRADLVAAMPADVVAASEFGDDISRFHFLIDELVDRA
jgi:hypothetical protein